MPRDQVKAEAGILAARLALRPRVVEDWMRANSLGTIADLKRRYPGKEHAECMTLATAEIWDFALSR